MSLTSTRSSSSSVILTILDGYFQRDMRKGDVIVVSPHEAHGFISDAEDLLEYLCVGCLRPRERTGPS